MDTIMVFATLMVSCVLYDLPFSSFYQVTAILAALLTLLFMHMVGVYQPRRIAFVWNEAHLILLAWGLVIGSLLTIAWATQNTNNLSQSAISAYFVATPLILILTHIMGQILLRMIRKKGLNQKKVAIVGSGPLAIGLAETIQELEWSGMQIIGFFDDNENSSSQSKQNITMLGKIDDIFHMVGKEEIDTIYIALPMHAEKSILKIYSTLQNTTVSIFLIPDLFSFHLMGARQCFVGSMPAFQLCETPLLGVSSVFKRIEDILISSIALLLMLPLMSLIALVIQITSPGPVFFKQHRYGFQGKKIRVYKFRSMSVCEDGYHISLAEKDDSRVTPFGAFLRRTSLDELPQLWNVLQGNMSIVGPRPLAVMVNEEYRQQIQGYMWRHKIKPGITGLAQISGWRGGDTLHRMGKRVECDLEYIRNWSIRLDMKILFRTVHYLLTSKDAY
ncbi:undecaprenyl-phosphate glucose phosphotransferase [Mariprofundus sp. EBB-1]|uniref:undecaprenyl-phosphate glucose phosphotransferase n=1 Tax=Mariprofundus sp. EBB-1 TaxID=2650971 RepID=UPI00191371C9|nr:undecaprenyl-phosphate glucose phosphotransferase [Mariprofundus sp. EBB-1]